ncbi:MAG TPA: hypothetical protein VJK54_09695 [Chthoniobacterales bacterium]|nr:hypothetical protein [Chthoniobacterales bacterium]
MATLVIKSFPDHLYAHLKQEAQAHRRSLTQEAIVIFDELFSSKKSAEALSSESLFTKGKIVPEYIEDCKVVAFSGATDSTDIISEERNAPKKISSGSLFANRKLLPGYAALEKSGALIPRPGDRDITDLISEDRDGCSL